MRTAWGEALSPSRDNPTNRTAAIFYRSHPALRSPGLGQDHRYGAALIALENVECSGVTAPGADPVLERRQPIQDILHHQLYADLFEIIIDRIVSGIVAEREIECVKRW